MSATPNNPTYSTPSVVGQAVEKYQELRPLYDAFAGKVKDILEDGIPEDCPVHSINFRAKATDSFRKKASKCQEDGITLKYKAPLAEITGRNPKFAFRSTLHKLLV